MTAAALALFEQALAHEGQARETFVRARCGDDAALRAEVDALLAAHAGSEGFLEPEPARFAPVELGPYRLIGRLGAGGMGQVYLAERRDGVFEQRVAVKVMSRSLADPDAVARAERERQFLAWLDHPNIAHVLDGGTTADGEPYVVMELVDGMPIDRWCREHALGPRERVVLFLQVLAAVDAAHRALIIHRDLKPGNILVTDAGTVKLLDFGIAKSLDERVGGGATHTGLGPLTPEYASPEQLSGKPLTTACDVYALGLVLYQLLVGRRAFDTDGRTLAQLEQLVTTTQPPRPSARLDAAALALPPGADARWRRQIAGDLDRVLLKALEPEPARRYASARACADDLERWLDDLPVSARGSDTGYRLRKFVSRHRWPVAASAAVILSLAVGLGIAATQAGIARDEADRAQRANAFLLEMISQADPFVSGRTPTLEDALDRAAEKVGQFADRPALEGDIRHAIGRAYLSLDRLDAAQPQLERAQALRRDDGGAPHAQVLDSLAMLSWSRGEYEQAEARLRAALAALDSGPQSQALRPVLLNDYAALLNELGRWDEAIAHLDDAVALAQRYPVAPADRAAMWSNRGYALHGRGDFEAASQAYQRARDAFAEFTPEVHPDTAIVLNNHASALRDLGRHEEALALLERSTAIRREIFGLDHPMLVTGLTNLALVQAEVGRHDDAERSIATALEHAPNAFPPDHQMFGHMQHNAARVAFMAGDWNAAAGRAQRAIEIYDAADAVEPGRRDKAVETRDAARAKLAEQTAAR